MIKDVIMDDSGSVEVGCLAGILSKSVISTKGPLLSVADDRVPLTWAWTISGLNGLPSRPPASRTRILPNHGCEARDGGCSGGWFVRDCGERNESDG